MNRRGRIPGLMTTNRRKVLAAMEEAAAQGEVPSLASLARRCGLYDYRKARRVLGDLRKMGAV